MNINQTMPEIKQLVHYEGFLMLIAQGTPASEAIEALLDCLGVSKKDLSRGIIPAELSDALHKAQAKKRQEITAQKAKNYTQPKIVVKAQPKVVNKK